MVQASHLIGLIESETSQSSSSQGIPQKTTSISYTLSLLMKGEKIFDSPFVAFDNSPHSLLVLDILDSMKAAIPKLNIVYVHDPKKIYLVDRDKGLAIYKGLKERYPEASNPSVTIELKDNLDKNTNLVLLQNFVAKGSSILFLGFVGSKGCKPRACDLSSRIRQFVYESKIHLAIVKKPSKELGKVLFLLDGSDTNFEGLTNAVEFCKLFGKQLTILHTFNQDLKKHSKHVRMQLKGEERKDCKWEVIFEQKSLVEAVKEREESYDWVIMNKNGYRGSINKQRFVGSNTSLILEEGRSNLIIFV